MAMPVSTARPRALMTVLVLAGITASLTQTLVVPLLGQLPQILHTSTSNATWVVTVTLLVSAVTNPVAGRLGDLYGKRRILLVSVALLIAGAVVCALATSLVPMIIGRSLQGMGSGIVALGISALRDLLPPERVGSAIALISSSLGVGAALGLPLAATVMENSSWRVLFWGLAGLAAVIGVLIVLMVPATDTGDPEGRFDPLGALGLGTGLVTLLLAVSKGALWGWTSRSILTLIAVGVVSLGLWAWWELRTRYPLVDLRTTGRPQVLLTNAASFVVAMGMYAQALLIPQLLQLPVATGYGLGQSMMTMGLWMAPNGIMMVLMSPVSARLSAARGPKTTLLVGCLIIATGYAASTVMLAHTWTLLIVTMIIYTGVAFSYGAMPALIMAAVPHSETAAANGFNTLMRAAGTSVSAAVIGAVLAQMSTNYHGHSIPTSAGFHTGLLIGCGVALLAGAITAAIPVRSRFEDSEPEPQPATPAPAALPVES
ncbi:MFS transporter [Nocardia aurantia]|uniref:Putative multidrug resistance protein EmrY n=1 Tax=Nocardia aurantia TaxID=2585199 RepID=A0A7K0DU94_9NOCA|nr:MFS transporter [Nocardia aurantia]MQY29330.1 putative multidrug resistance protein EmrY [Nocardia aurantia]